MITSLLAEINSAGWTLGYLRQAGPGWEAQLRRPASDPAYQFDISFHYALDPVSALSGALEQGERSQTKLKPWVPTKGVDILADLGLKKPLNRRI